MVHSPHRVPASGFLTADFPADRPASPAALTLPLSVLYGMAARMYHRFWDRRHPFRAAVPVISVGNLTVGGTGKTPFLIALARWIAELHPPLSEPGAMAVLSRGYGRSSRRLVVVEPCADWRETGDEPLLIKQELPQVSVVVHADRARAARFAVERLGARLLLLDDGFQHRRLARDIDIVLLDGKRPTGNGHLLPAGPLREPVRNLRRATLVVGVGEDARCARKLANQFEKPFIRALAREVLPPVLMETPDLPVFALASIARPERLVNSLRKNKLKVVGCKFFRDHHCYTPKDLKNVVRLAKQAGAQAIVTTSKDGIRLASRSLAMRVYFAGVSIELLDKEKLACAMEPICSRCV